MMTCVLIYISYTNTETHYNNSNNNTFIQLEDPRTHVTSGARIRLVNLWEILIINSLGEHFFSGLYQHNSAAPAPMQHLVRFGFQNPHQGWIEN